MKEFFKLKTILEVLGLLGQFSAVETEMVLLSQAHGRVLAQDLVATADLPEFTRTVVDGFAVRARDTFGASPSAPALLQVVGEINMGEEATRLLQPGETVRIATGGMLPPGADAVVMIEYTQELDAHNLEVFRSVSPLENVLQQGEDVRAGTRLLAAGVRLRPQDIGLSAALGVTTVPVYRCPRVAIISTGDEIVPIEAALKPGQMRDSNAYALAAQVETAGGKPCYWGIVPDELTALQERLAAALPKSDLILISGGSSVGTRDWAITAIQSFSDSQILVHGLAISPGKPTILAVIDNKPLIGLPGHPASAMIIMAVLGRPLLARLGGLNAPEDSWGQTITARLSRNLASPQGREDFVRVRLRSEADTLWADPILGKSGLISTMVKAHGWIQIPLHTEGLEKGELVTVRLFYS
ncbi:MAG: molybdopterin molybdotransferase MoeA [Deltaproteobacteria bacterium]|nr:molybdopterin molybdotransferase MoeA [Deltaproteobacteria bacterium]MBW1951881.1 molybdopterin molybdotransferase MoeA [Deltaproteobacteria bacterium]MBW1986976.1 molybdopterin molybdotransferase MoeA [Deltaproteobacteria bacterium]MBW2134492.1 molybdopterin molybdotransferase MoeA [Deltaproteobacteria bacterium]